MSAHLPKGGEGHLPRMRIPLITQRKGLHREPRRIRRAEWTGLSAVSCAELSHSDSPARARSTGGREPRAQPVGDGHGRPVKRRHASSRSGSKKHHPGWLWRVTEGCWAARKIGVSIREVCRSMSGLPGLGCGLCQWDAPRAGAARCRGGRQVDAGQRLAVRQL